MASFGIELTDLRLGFKGKVTLEVPEFRLVSGDRCLISGPSGSGKTVFLSVLLGQAPRSRVLSGRFRVRSPDGAWQDLDYPRYRGQRWLSDGAAVVYQDAMHSLHPYRSVETQCPARPAHYEALGLEPDYFLSQQFRALHARPGEVISAGGPRFPGDCSGGERQRISLLFPFVQRERALLVLDEPLTDIDRISERSVRAAIETLIEPSADNRDRAVVLVTHQLHKLPPESMQHYALQEASDGEPRRLVHLGLGPTPAPRASVSAQPRQAGFDQSPFFHLGLSRPYSYPNDSGFRLWPIEGLDLTPGASVGLIGESGSGKSTLLRAAAGLLHRRVYRGTFDVRLDLGDGRAVPLMDIPRRRRYGRIQYVSQDSTGALIPGERVERHLEWIRRHKGVATDDFWQRVDEWATGLRLYCGSRDRAHLLGLKHQGLSMGQKRRYGLLRAFLLLDIYQGTDAGASAGAAKLLLLDEISRGLDGDALDGLVGVLDRFSRAYNVALLVVSHDMGFIRRACTSLRMVFSGSLLPASIRAEDFAVITPDGEPIDPELNPYYRMFLESTDIDPALRVPAEERRATAIDDYTGCLLRRYIRCPAEASGAAGCVHQALRELSPNGAVGVCQ